MNEIALQDAVILTGKNESTLRRYFNKPENRVYRVIKGGKLFFDEDFLLKKYPSTLAPDSSGRLPESPRQTSKENARAPEWEHRINELMKDKDFLQKQIEEMRKEASAERAQYQDRQRESNIIIQSLQEKVAKQLPATENAAAVKEMDRSRSLKAMAIIALCLVLGCAVAFGIALAMGYKFRI